MEKSKIQRINELAKKQKNGLLTQAEKEEQMALRKEYLGLIKKNFIATMDNVSIKTNDGKIHKVKRNNK